VKILVSACLLGRRCRYDGGDNFSEAVSNFCRGHEIVPLCPEIASGAGCPRPPVEIRDGRVVTEDGKDRTEMYRAGVMKVLSEAEGAELAILKARSPTCGVREIYDGTFSHRRVKGRGLLAAALAEKGVPLLDEEDVAKNERHGRVVNDFYK